MSRRKNSVTRQVRRAYRQDELARLLMMPEKDFAKTFGMETVKDESDSKRARSSWRSSRLAGYYHFRDNGSKVLAVAHLDTVVRPDRRAPHFRNTQTGPAVVSGALDDRLGAYVILGLLPKLGISCDVLLTTDEEDGMSTASSFVPPKDYDHVIEFDRGGTDVVMYQYEDRQSRQRVEFCGAKMGLGSFSDIAYLEHLGVKAFNWGAGYGGDYHSERGYAFLNDTFAMVAKYARFNNQNAGVTMPHIPEQDDRRWGRQNWLDYGLDEALLDECPFCAEVKVNPETAVCDECGTCIDCGMQADDDCQCYVRHALSGKPLAAEATGWREHDEKAKQYNEMFGSPAATPLAIEA